MSRTEMAAEEEIGLNGEALELVAALAAVLLEYRRHRDETGIGGAAPARGVRWRMMARLEQLQARW